MIRRFALGFLFLCSFFQLTSSCLQVGQLAKCQTTSQLYCPLKAWSLSKSFFAISSLNASIKYAAYSFHEPHLYFDPCPPSWGQFEMYYYCLDELDIFLDYWIWSDSEYSMTTWRYDGFQRHAYAGECHNHTWYSSEYGYEIDEKRRMTCARLPRVCECPSLRLNTTNIKVYVDANPFYHSNVSQYNVTLPIASYDKDRCSVSAYCEDGSSLVVFDGKDHYEFGSSGLSGMCDAETKQWIVDDGIHEIVTINLLHMGCVDYN